MLVTKARNSPVVAEGILPVVNRTVEQAVTLAVVRVAASI
jgi:hypothetical protein